MIGLLILIVFAAAVLVAGLTAQLVWDARRPTRRTAGYAVARGLASDPGEMQLEFEEWWVDRPGGVRLPVWCVEDGEGEHDEPVTLVMVHGWGQSRIDMLAQIEPWRELVDRIVLYDLRGHGDAEGELSHLGVDEWQDLLAVIASIDGDGPVIMAGYSMGAVIALEAAAVGESMRMAGIIAYGVYDDFQTSLNGRLRRHHLPAQPFTSLAMMWFRLRGLQHRDMSDTIPDVAQPILFLHGRDDDVAPVAHAEQLVELAPDGELVVIDDAQHLDLREVDEEAHDNAVRAFVNRVVSRYRR